MRAREPTGTYHPTPRGELVSYGCGVPADPDVGRARDTTKARTTGDSGCRREYGRWPRHGRCRRSRSARPAPTAPPTALAVDRAPSGSLTTAGPPRLP